MKHTFLASRELNIGATTVKRGDPLLNIEIPGGVPLDCALNALGNGCAITADELNQRLAEEAAAHQRTIDETTRKKNELDAQRAK